MNSYETSATVEQQGQIHVSGVPFAVGTEVEITISARRPSNGAPADIADLALTGARARMQELFASVKGFRMSPKLRREDLYDR